MGFWTTSDSNDDADLCGLGLWVPELVEVCLLWKYRGMMLNRHVDGFLHYYYMAASNPRKRITRTTTGKNNGAEP